MTQPQEKPADQRPETPDFWCKRFNQGVMPWDAGQVPADLQAFAAAQPAPRQTLIPGCGSAYEAGFLAARGWPVVALDFSPVAVAKAREILGDWPGQLLCEDFFAYQPLVTLDLIYERAFLCAMPRRIWPDWGQKMAALLAPGARLAGYFFFSNDPKGPPFGITAEALDALLLPAFTKVEDRAVTDSIPVFAGRERWQVWQRV